MRYGSVSLLTLVNAIMLAGTSKAADTTTGNTSGSGSNGSASSSTSTTTAQKKSTATTPSQPVSSAQKPSSTSGTGSSSSVPKLNPVVVTAQQGGSYQATQASSPYYTQPLLDTPQSITIVPQQVIKDQNDTTLRDILKNVPGISFQAGEASSTVNGDNFSIRGFNARNDTFIDNIRDVGIYTHDPFNTEDVEVVKGPASAYEGYGETGGSVNLVSKTPQLTPDYEFSGGYGTSQYNRETVDVNQPISEFGDTGMAFRLNAMHQYNDVAARDYVYDGRYGFAPSLAFGLGTPTRVTLSFLQQRETDLPDYGFPFISANAVKSGTYPQSQLNQIAPLPYNNWYGMLYRDIEVATTTMPTLNIEHDFDGGAKLISDTRYERVNYYSYNTSARFDSALPSTVDQITQEMSARSEFDDLIDSKLYATIPFETWKIPHDMVVSLEYSHQNDIVSTAAPPSAALNPLTNMFNPDPYLTYNGPMVWTNPTNNQMGDLAASLFDTIKFTPQWELTGGMRYDHLTMTSLNTAVSPVASAQNENLASWRLALVYKPLPNGSIYAGYGTSYNPSIQGIADGASNDGFVANTATLPPEEDMSYEIGTKWDLLDEKLSVTGALFRTNKTNTRETDPTNSTVYILYGEQRVQGAEVDIAGNLTRDWKVFGGYVYMPSKVLNGPPNAYPGNALPNTPQQTASIWSTYDLPSHFVIGTGFQYMDARYSGINNLNCSPGYWTQQAMLGYQATKNVDIQLNVYNLWNEQYIDLVGAHQVVPGAGRTIVLTTSLKF